MRQRRLGTKRIENLPLVEISGLGQRKVGGRVEVLAVGDEDFTVVAGPLVAGEESLDFRTVDLRGAVAGGDPEAGSEWEAADGDSTGRVFILQESPGKVFVLDPSLERLETTVDLVLDLDEGPQLDWADSPNAQGEGLVLLQNGHVLVAKEKEPPLLMEFGTAREAAEGVEPRLLFSTSTKFPAPTATRSSFDLLSVWEVDSEAFTTIGDISDIAVGPDDLLYLLSDESRCIARLQQRADPESNSLRVTMMWEMPEDIEQPEGLVVVERQQELLPIVAVDRDEPTQNLFFLSPLDT